jgi:hypothetical protein
MLKPTVVTKPEGVGSWKGKVRATVCRMRTRLFEGRIEGNVGRDAPSLTARRYGWKRAARGTFRPLTRAPGSIVHAWGCKGGHARRPARWSQKFTRTPAPMAKSIALRARSPASA